MTKALLFLHLIFAACAIAVSVHLILRMAGLRRNGKDGDGRIHLHGRMLAIFYLLTVASGVLIYPEFRYAVRHLYFDSHVPAATGFFEIKEHFAALGILPALMIPLALLRPAADRTSGKTARAAGLVVLVVSAILLFNTAVGWYLVTLRSL